MNLSQAMSEENPTARELHELVSDLQHNRALLRTINKFALRLLSIPSKDELLWFVVREVVGRLGFSDCVIYLVVPGGGRLRQTAAIGAKNPKDHQIVNPLEIPIGDGITGTVARTGRPLIVADLSQDPRYIPDLEPALSEICVPLIIDGAVVGVIDSEDPRRGYFGEEHLEILTVVAAMTSEKLKLIDEARRAEERTEELRRLNDQFREEIAERKRIEEALEASRMQIQSIMDHSPAMIFLKDTDGRYVLANREFERLFGMTSDEVKGKLPADVMPSNLVEAASAQDMEVLRTGEASSQEIRFDVEGRSIVVLSNKFPIRDTAGKLTGVGTVASDISERIRAEEVLKESEQRLQSLLDHSPTAIFLKDREGRFQVVSRQFEEWRGLRGQEVLGRTSAEVFPRAIAERYESHDEQVLATGQASVAEIEVLRADGVPHTVLATKFPVVDQAGTITGVGAVIADITDRRRAERLLVEAMNVTTTFFILFGPDDRMVICNQGCREMYETDAVPMVPGARFEDLIRAYAENAGVGASEEETDAWVEERLNRRERLTQNYEYERRDGRWVEVSDYMLADGSIFTIGSDITDKKQVEAQLRQAQKMKAVGQLTGGVAHDFNNMLTAIIGSLDVIDDRLGDPGAVKRSLSVAMKAALNAADLIQRLLAFSRQQHLDHAVVNLPETICGMRGLLQTSVGAAVDLDLRLANDVRPIWTDTTQLESAIVNLAINARDAMPNGGRLTIEAANVELDEYDTAQNPEATPGSYVLLAVTDTGCGMPAEVRDRVFEPFFTTKEVGHGTGLGLSMVFGFVNQSGGHVSLRSEEGRGTCVTLFLPIAAATQNASAPACETKGDVRGSAETVLVVEDDAAVRQSAQALLEGLGYQVLLAETGREALALLGSHHKIDLLFTDTVMPGGMSGFDLAREALDRFPNLRVLRTSGYTAEAKAQDADLDCRIEWIAKPYREQPLAEKIRKVLDSPRD